jgi:hypothetical protein
MALTKVRCHHRGERAYVSVLTGREGVEPQGGGGAIRFRREEELQGGDGIEELVLPSVADEPLRFLHADVIAAAQLIA